MSADTEHLEDLPEEPEDREDQDDTKKGLPSGGGGDDLTDVTVLVDEDEEELYEPSPRGQGLRRSADPSVEDPLEVTDLVDDEASPYEQDAASRRARARKEADDVFVILPEQVEGEIPVVDTEHVTETENIDVPLLRQVPGDDPTEMTEAVGETELVDDDDLDQFATDIGDDDVFAEDVGDEFAQGGFDDFSGGIDDMEVEVVAPPGRSVFKWFVSLAAMGLIGAGAYTYFVNPDFFGPLIAWASGSQTPVATSTEGSPAGGATNVEGPGAGTAEVDVGTTVVPGSDGDGSPAAEEERLRREFREKLVLALRLGFKGE